MSYEKMAALVTRLANVTEQRTDLWERTSEDGVFQASFPTYAVRIDQRPGDSYQNESDIFVRIFDDDGTLIEEVSDSDLSRVMNGAYVVLVRLYEAARRQAMGVEAALDSILEALGGEGEVDPPGAVDADEGTDLPF